MGNYNCQECINKEVNILNELLLDNKYFSDNPNDKDNLNVSRASQIKNLRASKEEIKKAIESANLSEDQKNYVQKIINDNSNDFLQKTGKDTIKLRVSQSNNYCENINNSNENEFSLEQKRIIESQREQILAQQKIIEEYKKQQFLLEQQQNKLKEEEENLKVEIQKAKSKQFEEIEREKEKQIKEQNMRDGRIQNFEPSNSENQDFFQINNQQEQYISNKNNQEINMKLRQNIHPQDSGQEREEDNEPEDEQNEGYINKQQNRDLGNNIQDIQEIQQIQSTGICMGMGLPKNSHSQRFKIETYEPIEPGPKNSNENDNNIDINENKESDNNNESEDDDNNDDIYRKVQIKSNEPRDSERIDLRKPIIPKEKEKEEENINNYTKYSQEKNIRENGPKDNDKSNIEYQFKGSFHDNTNKNNIEMIEKMKITESGPRDSKRRDIQPKFNSIIFFCQVFERIMFI